MTVTLSACVDVPLRRRAAVRQQQYLASHREVPPEIAKAIDTGHVLLGMDRDQVWTVLGDPVRKATFSSSKVDVWLYPAVRLHQDQLHAHGVDSFRLVFMDGRLTLIEPI